MRCLAIILASIIAARAARADEGAPPAPRAVIYPGDVIAADMLVDATLEASGADGPIARARSEVVGKMSRRTLLPGRPIPLRALDNPRAIRNGAEVRLLYVDAGLTIVTAGMAMQDGSVGDIVKIRNSDSGVIVSGQVQADGAVLVNGG
jgi:flagella basal body P-ring formation protein FlgA